MGKKSPAVQVSGDVFERLRAKQEAARHVEWKHALTEAQRLIAEDPRRFKTICCGRRWGKSFLASHIGVEAANAGQGTVILAAPTYKTAKNGIWAHLVDELDRKFRKVHEGDMLIELTGGGRVQVGSLDSPDNLRGAGKGLLGILVDEGAFVADYAVQSVLRPMLLDENGWRVSTSTPKGRVGWFYRYWLRGQSADEQDADYASWQMPTWTNTALKNLKQEVDDLRNTMPENVFQQEIGAEFVDDAGAVFRHVQLCEHAPKPVMDGPFPRLTPGADYFIGIDFARSGSDWTVAYVLERLADGTLRTVWIGRWGRIEDEEQIDRLAAILLWFKPRHTIAEKNSFGAVYCSWMASKHKVTVDLFDTNGTEKGPLVQQAAAAFEFDKIEIWPETDTMGQVVVNELLSYERKQTALGHPTYSAPVGYHDDCVMALALAIRAADGDPGDPLAEAGHFQGEAEDYLVKGFAAPPQPEGGWEIGADAFRRLWESQIRTGPR